MSECYLDKLTNIGIALSSEKNIAALLDLIITEAISLTSSDAGTLYLVDKEFHALRFEIMYNNQRNGSGKYIKKADLPPVPLYFDDGNPNFKNVSSYVALKGESVNVKDVYGENEFDFSGAKKYDAVTGYTSKSMLVVPMKDHNEEVIGVVQLINATDPDTGGVLAVSQEHVALVSSLASQAAVALNNARLIQDLEDLLFSFVKSIASAIDAKSKFTGNHIRRVESLTMIIARALSATKEAPFAELHLNDDNLKELSLAAWLHDVGKIVTPQHLIDKRYKLEGVHDGIELIKTRFQLIEAVLIQDIEKKKNAAILQGADKQEIIDLEFVLKKNIEEIHSEFDFINNCNRSSEYMSDDKIERLQTIKAKSFMWNGTAVEYLSDIEFEKLSIRKGNLTGKERSIIEDHVQVTWDILSNLPFPKNIGKVAEYASQHHERLDGSGYILGLTKDDLSLQSRILAIADIFEALTASDRPYKIPMPISRVLKIMEFMKKDGHLDPEVLDFFIENRIYMDFGRGEVAPSQIDVE